MIKTIRELCEANNGEISKDFLIAHYCLQSDCAVRPFKAQEYLSLILTGMHSTFYEDNGIIKLKQKNPKSAFRQEPEPEQAALAT